MEAKTISDAKNVRKAILLAVEDKEFRKLMAKDPAGAIDKNFQRLNFRSSELNENVHKMLKSLTDDEIGALSRIPDIARRGGYEPLGFF
jgi:hypothetical protein